MEEYTNSDILGTVDSIIEKIQNQRKIMLGVSISALILAPFAVGLSIYLLMHPTFFYLLETEDEFGLFLGILLGGIIIISGIWLYTGIRQYNSLSSWNKRYCGYLNKKKVLDDSISNEFQLSKD
ncbi:MAG: hypothetical protein ACE5RN_08580 [Nitrosopumilaceae archaeon]